MAEPANPRGVTLEEAATFVADGQRIEPDEARTILLKLLLGGEICARGAVPWNAHHDVEWAWQHAAGAKVEDIPAGTWALPVNWTRGRVGRYREITIPEQTLMAMFRTSRGPGKRASPTTVKRVVEEYAASERKAQRPLSQTRCWEYVKDNVKGATREQALAEYRNLETPKQRGRPRKRNSPE
jgi:hypothetical protein